MAKELFTSLRRFAAIGFILLLLSFCLSVPATGQVSVPAPPFVVSSAGFSPQHTFDSGAQIFGTAIAPNGDVLAFDVNSDRLWHFPADGSPAKDVGLLNGYKAWQSNFDFAVDSRMNLYIGGNYGPGGQGYNGILKMPYDSVNRTWSAANASWLNGGTVPSSPGIDPGWGFQPAAVALDQNENLVVSTLGGGSSLKFYIFTFPVKADGSPDLASGVVRFWGMKAQANWMKVDAAGNIYFAEASYGGVYMLPAGQSILDGTGDGSYEIGPGGLPKPPLVRLDMPDPNKTGAFLLDGAIQGLALDAAGNLYYGNETHAFNDPNMKGGIWMVPNEGTVLNPVFNPAHTVLVAPIPTKTFVIDSKSGALWASFYGSWNGLQDFAKFTFGRADLGSAAAGGKQGGTVTIFNAFNTTETKADADSHPNVKLDWTTQAAGSNFVDATGGTCAAGNYFQNDRCTLMVAFKPASNVVGNVEGSVNVIQKVCTANCDTDKVSPVYQHPIPVVSTTTLQGLATSGELAFFNSPLESVIGTGIAGTGQVATDSAGNIYVAASKSVLVYPPNANASTIPGTVGKNFTAPTGVAVDGMGNIFIADSGNIVKVPFQEIVTGTDKDGNPIIVWGLNPDAQTTIKTGLGASVKLAANAAGYLFAADPDHQRVLRIRIYYSPSQATTVAPPASGLAAATEDELSFTALSGIGLDATGNLLVADGTNAIQVNAQGQQTVIATSIGAANALAMDPSGALYYSTASGAFRVPVESGVLDVSDKVPLGTGVTATAGIALGSRQNVYLADVANSNLHVVSVDGAVNFGTINLGDHTSLDSLVYNVGNADVAFTLTSGYFSNSSDLWMGMTTVNFTAVPSVANGCVDSAPLTSGSTCSVTTTLSPDNGREGTLQADITMTGTNIANASVNLYATGVGAALASSKIVMVVDPSVNANSAKIGVTVTPANGTGTPTGRVTVLIDSVAKETKSIGADSTASFDLHPVKAGSHVYTAAYEGDRVYGRATAVQTIKVAKGATAISQPALAVIAGDQTAMWIPYVLSSRAGANQNADPYYYHYLVQVIAGGTMIPTPGECKTYAETDPCGKVILVDSAKVIQNSQKASDTTGVSDISSANFDYNRDSTALHPVTTYTVTPVYYGDDNYLPATGTTVTFVSVLVPSVWIDRVDTRGNPVAEAGLSVAAGTSTAASFRARSMFGFGDLAPFTGQAEFHCDNLPPYAACSFSPARVTVNSTTDGYTTVTITTNVPVGTVVAHHNSSTSWLFAAMFGFGAFGLVFGRKTRLNGHLLMAICAILIISGALAGVTACSTSNGASPNPVAKTPAGTYNVTISATQVGGVPSASQTTGWEADWASIPYTVKVTVQ